MEITPQMMELKTIGTTINLIRLRKIVPRGLTKVTARSALPKARKTRPATMPSPRAIKICAASESLVLVFIKFSVISFFDGVFKRTFDIVAFLKAKCKIFI